MDGVPVGKLINLSDCNEAIFESKDEILTVNGSLCEEDVFIENVFRNCDKSGTGKVQIVTLLNYLKEIEQKECANPIFTDATFDEVWRLFSRERENILVNITDFRTIFGSWLLTRNRKNSIRTISGSSQDMTVNDSFADRSFDSSDSPIKSVRGGFHPLCSSRDDLANISSIKELSQSNLEGFGGQLSMSLDPLDMQAEIEELKHQNARLVEKYNNVEKQLISQEDSFAHYQAEARKVEDELLRLQFEKERHAKLTGEIEELKSQLLKSEDRCDEFETRFRDAEKANTFFEAQVNELKNLVSEAQLISSSLKDDLANVEEQLIREKALRSTLEQNSVANLARCAEHLRNEDELREVVVELRERVDELRKQKSRSERKMTRAQNEIQALYKKVPWSTGRINAPYSENAEPIRIEFDEVESVTTDDSGPVVSTVGKRRPVNLSIARSSINTPKAKQSLFDELSCHVLNSELPSPLRDRNATSPFDFNVLSPPDAVPLDRSYAEGDLTANGSLLMVDSESFNQHSIDSIRSDDSSFEFLVQHKIYVSGLERAVEDIEKTKQTLRAKLCEMRASWGILGCALKKWGFILALTSDCNTSEQTESTDDLVMGFSAMCDAVYTIASRLSNATTGEDIRNNLRPDSNLMEGGAVNVEGEHVSYGLGVSVDRGRSLDTANVREVQSTGQSGDGMSADQGEDLDDSWRDAIGCLRRLELLDAFTQTDFRDLSTSSSQTDINAENWIRHSLCAMEKCSSENKETAAAVNKVIGLVQEFSSKCMDVDSHESNNNETGTGIKKHQMCFLRRLVTTCFNMVYRPSVWAVTAVSFAVWFLLTNGVQTIMSIASAAVCKPSLFYVNGNDDIFSLVKELLKMFVTEHLPNSPPV